ncbi:MAG TPA: LEA type 2 family protein [Gemmatimonadaceae bacterium]|nr:LEA type 2 family protein [Gemmatimonadaceae bacterium]
MRKAVLLAVAAATVAGSSGCASLGRQVFKEPVVNFQQLSINGLGLTGGSLDVVLSVYNPNNFKLDATRLTYNLMIDSVRFGTGALDQKFTVQSGDSTIVRLPVAFTYAGIGEAGRQLINTGTVNYRVTGDVTVGTPLGSFTRPYDRSGRYTALRGSR